VADTIISRRHGAETTSAYDGRGICYLEFGDDRVAKVDVTFHSGEAPSGQFEDPSELLVADKAQFGTSRVQRWFGRAWQTV
jgi:sulfide:quinone oxidoreductase